EERVGERELAAGTGQHGAYVSPTREIGAGLDLVRHCACASPADHDVFTSAGQLDLKAGVRDTEDISQPSCGKHQRRSQRNGEIVGFDRATTPAKVAFD